MGPQTKPEHPIVNITKAFTMMMFKGVVCRDSAISLVRGKRLVEANVIESVVNEATRTTMLLRHSGRRK